MKLDGKFKGQIVKNKDGSVVSEDQWIVFLANDNAVPATLAFYIEECRRLEAAREQIVSAGELLQRVVNWRLTNPDKCKTPDVEPNEVQLD